MENNVFSKYWLLALVITLLAGGKTVRAQQQTVISGRLSGADGSAMAKAHVHLARPNQSKPLTSVEVAKDGAFKILTGESGLLFVQFTGVNHLSHEVLLYVEKPEEVKLSVRLKPYEYRSDLSGLRIIGDFNQFASQSARPMQKQPDGTYAAEFETSEPRFAYQLLGVTKSGNSINGTQSEDYVYDGGGDYRSVVTPKNGRVRIVFDPRLLLRADASAKVHFSDADSRAAKLALVYDEMLKRRRSFSAALAAHKAAGKPAYEFHYDWTVNLADLAKQITAEKDALLRQVLLFSYLDLGFGVYGAKLAASLSQEALAEIPPTSPLWSLEPDLLGVALEGTGQPAKYSEYVRRIIEGHTDQRVRDLAKKEYAPERKITVGKLVPSFSVASLDRLTTTYTNENMRGKVYVIDFWATWCKPCVEEMENLHRVYEKYRGRGFEILSLSLDDKPETVSKFRNGKWKMPWLNAFLSGGFDNDTVKLFEISGIPKPILVNRVGEILAVGRDLRGPNLDKTLARVFRDNK